MIAIKENTRLRKERPDRQAAPMTPIGGPAAGLTIIEILLALTVFSVGLLAVAGMQISSVNKNTSSRKNTMAVEYASGYMERLLGLGMDTNITKNGVDEDGDDATSPATPYTGTDEPDEVLGFPDLADDGSYHSPADYPVAAVDYDNDGLEDIPVDPEFNGIFDMYWVVTDGTSGSGTSIPEGPIKMITIGVTWGYRGQAPATWWGNNRGTIYLTCIKATAL